jgi:predicted MPP superfamily phosphohydrolase
LSKARWRTRWLVLAGVVVLLVGLAVWSFLIEPRLLRVRYVEISLPALAHEHDGLRIAVLTDLHVGSPHHGLPMLGRIVSAVNQEQPDAVLILGDIVIQGVLGGKFVPPEQIAPVLGQLQSRFGSFAVLGNHDWWLDAPRVSAALELAGITLLEDAAAAITVDGEPLWLAGVSDFWEGAHDVEAALQNVPEAAPVILFTHNPDIFPRVPARVSLTIAGHTHGGQVNLPLLGRPIVPSQFDQRYAAGHIVENGRNLFVSTGLGTSILPIRFRVPPEIVVVTIRVRRF